MKKTKTDNYFNLVSDEETNVVTKQSKPLTSRFNAENLHQPETSSEQFELSPEKQQLNQLQRFDAEDSRFCQHKTSDTQVEAVPPKQQLERSKAGEQKISITKFPNTPFFDQSISPKVKDSEKQTNSVNLQIHTTSQ